jgi:hypothetical protein
MAIHVLVKHSEYHDSVALMLAAQALQKMAGVVDAAVVMGTPANREILAEGRSRHRCKGRRRACRRRCRGTG